MSDNVLEAKPILERFRLDGRVALVTGGDQGIGRAFAHALGEAGAMELTPMGRFVEVTDLQRAVVYLASEASDMMTGHDLVIDGGYCVW